MIRTIILAMRMKTNGDPPSRSFDEDRRAALAVIHIDIVKNSASFLAQQPAGMHPHPVFAAGIAGNAHSLTLHQGHGVAAEPSAAFRLRKDKSSDVRPRKGILRPSLDGQDVFFLCNDERGTSRECNIDPCRPASETMVENAVAGSQNELLACKPPAATYEMSRWEQGRQFADRCVWRCKCIRNLLPPGVMRIDNVAWRRLLRKCAHIIYQLKIDQ